jgi:hypothetical protein
MNRKAVAFALVLLVLTSCIPPFQFYPQKTLTPIILVEKPVIESTATKSTVLLCQPLNGNSSTSIAPENGGIICQLLTGTPIPDPAATQITGTAINDCDVDPHVEISSSTSEVKIGESLTIAGKTVDIGLPIFYVNVLDMDSGNKLSFRVQNGEVEQKEGQSGVLELVGVEADNWQVTLTFKGIGVGKAEVKINATGEIHSCEGATWGGGGSKSLEIEVINS